MKHLALLLLAFSGALWAQPGEMWIIVGASLLTGRDIGSPSPAGSPNDIQLGPGYRVGLRLSYNSAGHLGQEIQYAYDRTDLTDNTGAILRGGGSAGMAFHQGGYNLLYYLNRTDDGAKVRPFATVGVHLNDFVLPADAVVEGSSVRWGINYGGGIKFRISQLFALRGDIRGYDSAKPNWNGLLFKQGGILLQTEASMGFGIYF